MKSIWKKLYGLHVQHFIVSLMFFSVPTHPGLDLSSNLLRLGLVSVLSLKHCSLGLHMALGFVCLDYQTAEYGTIWSIGPEDWKPSHHPWQLSNIRPCRLLFYYKENGKCISWAFSCLRVTFQLVVPSIFSASCLITDLSTGITRLNATASLCLDQIRNQLRLNYTNMWRLFPFPSPWSE